MYFLKLTSSTRVYRMVLCNSVVWVSNNLNLVLSHNFAQGNTSGFSTKNKRLYSSASVGHPESNPKQLYSCLVS